MTYSVLGIDTQTDQRVEISQSARRQGLYLIGIQGTGKSGLIENLIIQDIKQNMGVCLLDPHGDLTHAVLSRIPDHRVKDVIYLDIADYHNPFGINPFTCSDTSNPFEVQKIVDQVRHIFEKLLSVSMDTQLILEYLYNCTYTLIVNPGYTMADIPLLLQDTEFRRKLVANVTDIDVQLFWRLHDQKKPADQVNDIASTLRRVRLLLQPISRPIVGQSTSTIDVRKVMDEGKILLVKLDITLESVTSLVGSLIVALFLNAAISRADLPVNKRRQFNLYADEFQRFATDDFATLLEEARKFGVGITIAHQNGSQLENNLKERARSVANLVVFKVNRKDAEELAGEFDITPQEAREEELRTESLEIREQQWLETLEIQDGEEPIKTYLHDVILQLFRVNHPDPRVMRFTRDYLRPVEGLLYQKHDPMRGQPVDRRIIVRNIRNLEPPPLSSAPSTPLGKPEDVVLHVYMLQDWLFEGMIDKERICEEIPLEFTHPFLGKRVLFNAYTYPSLDKADSKILAFYRDLLAPDEDILNPENRYNPDLYNPEDRPGIIHTLGRLLNIKDSYEKWVMLDKKMREEVKANLAMTEKEYDELFTRYSADFLTSVAKAISFYDHAREGEDPYISIRPLNEFLRGVRLCQLGLYKEPIYTTQSGHFQPRKRQQILMHPEKTFTHPRIAIPHPQRTYADMLNEVASQLTNLPVFTARVKAATDTGNTEHTIITLDPKREHDKPLFGLALQERKNRIKEQNIRDGYVRERAEVEEEIRQRHEQTIKPPEEEPPVSRRKQ